MRGWDSIVTPVLLELPTTPWPFHMSPEQREHTQSQAGSASEELFIAWQRKGLGTERARKVNLPLCSGRERQWLRTGSKTWGMGPMLKSVPTPQVRRSHSQGWPHFSDLLRTAWNSVFPQYAWKLSSAWSEEWNCTQEIFSLRSL